MGTVVSLTQPDQNLIALLEDLLAEAKRGELTDVVAVVGYSSLVDFLVYAPQLGPLEVIGAIEMLKQRFLAED